LGLAVAERLERTDPLLSAAAKKDLQTVVRRRMRWG
jgi:hypothetical protein